MDKKTLKDIDLKGKKVVMRVDFNVPVKEGVIKDDTRIKGALASINYVLDNGGSLILMSHMGRPDEKGITGDTTMKIVAEYLAKLLGKEVKFAGTPGDLNYLNDSSKMCRLFGYPRMSLDEMIRLQAQWIADGGISIGKPTHFEVNNGKF